MDPFVSYRVKRPAPAPSRAIPPLTGCACCSCPSDGGDEFCRAHGDGITYRSCEDHREAGRIHMDVTHVAMMMSVQQKRNGIDDLPNPTAP